MKVDSEKWGKKSLDKWELWEFKEEKNHGKRPSRSLKTNISFWKATVPALKIARGNFTLPNSNNVFFIVEVCRLNTVILKCFRIIQTMTKWTYFLINFCRLNTHSTLIITKLAGSTHHVRIAGFQRREGGEILFFFFNHIAIDLLRATAEMLQANNLHPIRKDKLREDR